MKVTMKKSNQERLESFKLYFYDNKEKISYKTYLMMNGSCKEILNNYLTQRNIELLNDLKEHTMFLSLIYKQIKENYPNESKLSEIKDKFTYYKDWIIRESDTTA